MQIQQLSIFVENKSGRLAEITEILGTAGVDIRAISVADTSDFGILRLIVDKPKEAVEALRAANLTVSLTSVIAVGIDDKPVNSPRQCEFWRTVRSAWNTCTPLSAGTKAKPMSSFASSKATRRWNA